MAVTAAQAPPVPETRAISPGLAGAIGAGLAMGLAELFAGLVSTVPSAVSAIGTFVIVVVPSSIESLAISLFGTADKAVLAIGTTLISLLVGVYAGRASVARRWVLAVVFTVFAVLGIVAGADTVSFCFSKGLGAPVGSAVVGSAELIEEIRYLRARMGGGMRQVGILAAAASIALRDRARLVEDHRLAQYLAAELADRHADLIDPESVETNIVNIRAAAIVRPWPQLAADFESEGIAVYPPFDQRFRVVTHRDVDRNDVDRLVDIITRMPE